MQKLIRGILDFRKNVLPKKREMFARLAHGQAPDVLLITCSDSRVAPNWFASTDPGDLFVVRNVGNIVPPCDDKGASESDYSVAAAIEFSLNSLKIADIVVCGHSGCGAIHAMCEGIDKLPAGNLKNWLNIADLESLSLALKFEPTLPAEDQISQKNVLRQIENLKTYPKIREKFKKGELRLHAWWFDIAQAGVFTYDLRSQQFILIDDVVGKSLLAET